MVSAYRARVAPFNVNYRYVAEQLTYRLREARSDTLVYHAELAAGPDHVGKLVSRTPPGS